MSRSLWFWIALGLVSFRAVSHPALSQTPDEGGIWAAAGRSLDSVQGRSIASPDRRFAVSAEAGVGTILVGPRGVTPLREVLSPPASTEVLWSPDSQAFVINSSDGGLVGKWDAYLYIVEADGHVTGRTVRPLVDPLVRTWPECGSGSYANIGAAGWSVAGSELLIVAEVPPHSACRNMGAILGFRVSVRSWRVVERVPEDGLRVRLAPSLGPRFRR